MYKRVPETFSLPVGCYWSRTFVIAASREGFFGLSASFCPVRKQRPRFMATYNFNDVVSLCCSDGWNQVLGLMLCVFCRLQPSGSLQSCTLASVTPTLVRLFRCFVCFYVPALTFNMAFALLCCSRFPGSYGYLIVFSQLMQSPSDESVFLTRCV